MQTSTYLLIFLGIAPILLAGLIIGLRPKIAPDYGKRFEDWLTIRHASANAHKGMLQKFIILPLMAPFRALHKMTEGISGEHTRIAVRLAASLYLTYLLLFCIWFLKGFIFLFAIVAGMVGTVVLFRNSARHNKLGGGHDKELAEAEAAFKAPDIEAWNKLGSSAEEREKNIKSMFDNKKGNVSCRIFWRRYNRARDRENGRALREPSDYYEHIRFRVSRNLAAMEQKEREFLRTAYLLFNAEKISEDGWRYYCFAFINGNGKASIDDWGYLLGDNTSLGVKDGPSAVRFVQDRYDASVDGAVNSLMSVMDEASEEDETHAVVNEIHGRLRGGGAWLSAEDIPGTIFSASNNPFSLRLGRLEASNEELNYAGEGSLMTIAPPGSGKTQCFVLPNMLRWPGAALVLDVKGEIYEATSKWRSKNVGPVFKFSPLDPANSHCYNPLVFIRQDPDYLWEEARFLADMMIVPSGAADPFWENMARDVLTAAIAYVCYENAPDQRPMSKIMNLLYGMDWDKMVMSLKTNLAVAAMRQMGHSLEEMEKKTRDSVLKTAQSSMSAWQGERIAKSTRQSDWSPLDLRNGKPTIYICVNPNQIESLLSLLRVFIAQHIHMLTSQLPPRDAAPVLFVLDELPRLKKMQPIDEALNIGRQYGIRLWMFAQSYGQLKESYPNAEGMLGSCAVRTFMNVPLNDELAQKLSDQLGYREGPLDASRTKLVEPLELAGPNYKDIVLVLASNTKPAKAQKVFAYQDAEIQARMNGQDNVEPIEGTQQQSIPQELAQLLCPGCGIEFFADDAFCGECGHKLK